MQIHRGDYSILAVLSLLYLGVIARYQTNPKYLLVATAVFASLYFVWGLWHQYRTHNLHWKIVLEYLLVGLLGVTIISSLLV